MLDNQLINAFRPLIITGLLPLTNVAVEQAYQPVQQGINSTPTIRFFKLYDRPFGFLKREDEWDIETERNIHTEIQNYETTFQVNGLITQSVTSTTGLTASDLTNMVARILQSDAARLGLRSAGIGILRITEVRNPYFSNDKDRFQASPSFDFILTHEQVSLSINPVIESTEFGIYRV